MRLVSDNALLTSKLTPISVRAIESVGYQKYYFVFQVTIQSDVVLVDLLDMNPTVSPAHSAIQLLVYPDGTVIKQ